MVAAEKGGDKLSYYTENYEPYYDPEDNSKPVLLFDVDIISETDKSWLLRWNTQTFRLPKSRTMKIEGKSTVSLKTESRLLDKNNVKY